MTSLNAGGGGGPHATSRRPVHGLSGIGQAMVVESGPSAFLAKVNEFAQGVRVQAATLRQSVTEQVSMRDQFPLTNTGSLDTRDPSAPLTEVPMDGETYKVTGLSRKGMI